METGAVENSVKKKREGNRDITDGHSGSGESFIEVEEI